MKLITNLNGNYYDDPIRYFGFEDYLNVGKECILYIGAHPDNHIYSQTDVPKYFLSTEEQFNDTDTTDLYVDHVEKIFTICPPRVTNRNKRVATFFPVNEKYIPKDIEKKHDVIYAGFATPPFVIEILDVIRNFNYRHISFKTQVGTETNLNIPYLDKLKLISESKVSVIHNLLTNGFGVDSPQLKSRTFESAFCKSLILCKEDSWNLIDDWFEKDKEYISFNSKSDLNEKLNYILNNFSEYEKIVENAYNKAINNYTSEKFITNLLNKN